MQDVERKWKKRWEEKERQELGKLDSSHAEGQYNVLGNHFSACKSPGVTCGVKSGGKATIGPRESRVSRVSRTSRRSPAGSLLAAVTFPLNGYSGAPSWSPQSSIFLFRGSSFAPSHHKRGWVGCREGSWETVVRSAPAAASSDLASAKAG